MEAAEVNGLVEFFSYAANIYQLSHKYYMKTKFEHMENNPVSFRLMGYQLSLLL